MNEQDKRQIAAACRGERNCAVTDMRGAHSLRFNGAGQIVEGWGFSDDQDALDAFFSV